MMIMVGDALLGPGRGRIFMLCEAFTVFLALIGTTLSCMNTGARVTYAMGKDRELSGSLGVLHEKNLTPHRAIWTLAAISAIFGCLTVVMFFGDGSAPADAAIQALPHGFWSSFGYSTHDKMAALPNSFLTVTLASNFGTFLLYGLSCVICLVACALRRWYCALPFSSYRVRRRVRQRHAFRARWGYRLTFGPPIGGMRRRLSMLDTERDLTTRDGWPQ